MISNFFNLSCWSHFLPPPCTDHWTCTICECNESIQVHFLTLVDLCCFCFRYFKCDWLLCSHGWEHVISYKVDILAIIIDLLSCSWMLYCNCPDGYIVLHGSVPSKVVFHKTLQQANCIACNGSKFHVCRCTSVISVIKWLKWSICWPRYVCFCVCVFLTDTFSWDKSGEKVPSCRLEIFIAQLPNLYGKYRF